MPLKSILMVSAAASGVLLALSLAFSFSKKSGLPKFFAAAYILMLLRLLAGYAGLEGEPGFPLRFLARFSSGAVPLLLALGVYGLKKRRPSLPVWTFAGASTLWLMGLTLAKAPPSLAVLPLEVYAAFLCLGARAGTDGETTLLNASLLLLAARGFARPFLYHLPLPAEPLFLAGTLLSLLPGITAILWVYSKKFGEAEFQRELFTAAMEAPALMAALSDKNGRLVEANTALIAALGEPAASLVGRDLKPLLDSKNLACEVKGLPRGEGLIWFVVSDGLPSPWVAKAAAAFDELLKSTETPLLLAEAASGRLVEANEGAKALLGLKSEPQPLLDLWGFAPPGLGLALRDKFRTSAQGAPIYFNLQSSSGETFPATMAYVDVERGGRLLWKVYVSRDESKEASARMESSGALALGLAHDLKNILHAIMTCSDVLLCHGEENPDALKAISQAAKKGDSLVKKILSGDGAGKPSELDLRGLAEEAAGIIRPTLPEGVTLETRLAPYPVMGRIAREEAEQAAMNLLVNALEALEGAGTIRLTVRSEGEEALLTVEDSGKGVPPDLGERIFQPLVTTKGRPGGVGLASVKAAMERCGGKVVCAPSADLGGAAFTLRFRWPIPNEKGGVLVVDTEHQFRAEFGRALTMEGYRVHTTENGDRALSLLNKHLGDIGVVVMDLVSEGTGGRRLLEEIRKTDPRVRVVVYSSITADEAREGALAGGAREFLAKPLAIRELMPYVSGKMT